MLGVHRVLFQLYFDDYEILRNYFIPQNNNDEPKAFPVWNAHRVTPTTPTGYPIRVFNQWDTCFVFKGSVKDFQNNLRVARFVAFTDNVIGYVNYTPDMD